MSLIDLDVLIIGGGIAGLWLLDELRRRGYTVLLVETAALGAGQTIAAQGIIHGGLKYALSGLMNSSADAIKEMPGLWRECFENKREPHLAAIQLRDTTCCLWRTDALTSQLGMIGARIGLRVTPKKISDAERPLPLTHCPGDVFRVEEIVVEPKSLLEVFKTRNEDRMIHVAAIEYVKHMNEVRVTHPAKQQILRLHPRNIILTAGEGNAKLRECFGLSATAMQNRPLHCVIAKGALPLLNGHCVDGAKTRVTITTQRGKDGINVWQIGGQITEDGVKQEPEELAAHTRRELSAVLPKFPLPQIAIATFRINRAEAAREDGGRPADVQTIHEGNIITCWPTKLALALRLANRVRKSLPKPSGKHTPTEIFADWPRPLVAQYPWETPQCDFAF